jgi:hypothetical protein
MNKRIIANRFGLIALMSLSLFASTAFAGNTPAPTQVVVTNTPAQPVPMVGLVKDSDASARKPFQWFGNGIPASISGNTLTVTTVPLNQRLVIEDVSGYCQGSVSLVYLASHSITNGYKGFHYLPATFWNGTGPASTPVRFYVDPGQDFNLLSSASGGSGFCYLAVSGYFVDLP